MKKAQEIFSFFECNGIKTILIKGISSSYFYPQNYNRIFEDIDLCVSNSDFYKAQQLTKNKFIGWGLDLHKELRHLDTVSWENLFQNSQILKINDVEMRVLCPEDHLRVMCVHWLNDGGERRDKLWDIYWLISNRPKNFNWERCLNTVSKRRRRWIICTIGLAHKYLGLDLSETPIEKEAKELPHWLIKGIEKEWKSDIRLIPLKAARRNYKTFIQQFLKRFPPNPITATIDCEGDFDARTRIFYQIRDIFIRLSRKY